MKFKGKKPSMKFLTDVDDIQEVNGVNLNRDTRIRTKIKMYSTIKNKPVRKLRRSRHKKFETEDEAGSSQ